jgi:FkbM family methyltransferase
MNRLRRAIFRRLDGFLRSGRFGDTELRKLFAFLPRRCPTYVDVGAFDGRFFETVRREVRLTSALLIEPQPEYHALLQARFGRATGVRIVNRLVGEGRATVPFHANVQAATSSILEIDQAVVRGSFDTSRRHTTTMETVSLDELTADADEAIGLLKIDVQGAELEVLKGASRTLRRTEHIWIEVSFRPLYFGSPVFGDLHLFLQDREFRLVSLLEGFRGAGGELLQADCLFRRAGPP